ncbi:MAG TPA: alpha/beta hydrolase [Dehalococcoidia bacterium]|nr:alpha/beta hydrolase [Dehalococcoidia bacterium]
MQKPQDKYVKAGDVNTRYWSAGDTGNPVILLHPGLSSVENWVCNIDALAQNHRIYAIDMLGFGYTGLPNPPYSLEKAARHVSDFIESQGIEKVSIIGHCGGGVVSMYFAFQFSDKLQKLVLVDSWGFGKEAPFITKLGTLPVLGELIMRPSRKSAEMIMKMCVYDSSVLTDEMIDDFYRCMSLPGGQKAYMSVFRAIGNFGGPRTEILQLIRDKLPTIKSPTLIIWGKQDRSLPVTHADVAKEMIPNSRLNIFDLCGHMPPTEYPEKFNNLVLEFLSH